MTRPLLALATLGILAGCFPPDGLPPDQAPGAPQDGAGQGPEPLPDHPRPEVVPFTAWTRGPVSLVDERGRPLHVLEGHHTRVTVLHLFKERARVRCDLCTAPAEGWVQWNLLRPEGVPPGADEARGLNAFVARTRTALLEGAPVPGLPEAASNAASREALVRLLDQGVRLGFAEAVAPAAGSEPTIELRRGPEGWHVAGWHGESGSGSAEATQGGGLSSDP